MAYQPDHATLGGRIRYARKCRRLLPHQLAPYLGVETGLLTRWEAGQRIEYRRVRQLAYFLQCPIDWLVYGGEPAPVRPLTTGELLMARTCDIKPSTRLHKLRQAWPGWPRLPTVELRE